MREVIYKPINTGDGVIVQYTDSFILDKGMKISVPNQYIAVVFDNEKISFRVEPCVGKVIFKEYGKNFLGHTSHLTNATRYYYSESQPVESGKYWHYVDGEIVIW